MPEGSILTPINPVTGERPGPQFQPTCALQARAPKIAALCKIGVSRQ